MKPYKRLPDELKLNKKTLVHLPDFDNQRVVQFCTQNNFTYRIIEVQERKEAPKKHIYVDKQLKKVIINTLKHDESKK